MSGKRKGPIIAVDGPSGVGKSTISRLLAQRLNLRYINTGSMYRAIALAAAENKIDIDNDEEIKKYCSRVSLSYDPDSDDTLINGKSYSGRIREQAAGELASKISTKKPVRELLTRFQRSLGEPGSVVMEGRDIGTVVFPNAEVKVFLDALPEVRAKRRHLEIAHAAHTAEEVGKEIRKRDERDTKRANAPLKMADDAIYVDTSELRIEDVVERIVSVVRGKKISMNPPGA